MIVGVGIDVLSVARMERELRDPAAFRDEVFTSSEISYCESKSHPARHFAARFAAKEAALKALGGPTDVVPSWRDVEIRTDEGGVPRVLLHGRFEELAGRIHADALHVSLTHTAEFAAATVIAETNQTAIPQQEVTA